MLFSEFRVLGRPEYVILASLRAPLTSEALVPPACLAEAHAMTRLRVISSVPHLAVLTDAHATEVVKLMVWLVRVSEDMVEVTGVVITFAEFQIEFRLPLPLLLALGILSAGLAQVRLTKGT